jgi:hypothetical protein
MSDLYGFASGLQAAQQGQMQKQEFAQQMAEGGLKLQQEQVNLDTSKLALQSQQSMMKRMASMGTMGADDPTGITDTVASQMDQMTQLALASGRPEEAKEYAKTASTLRTNQAKITEEQRKISNQKLKDVSDLLGNVTDANSWRSAVNTFQMLHPDEAKDPQVQRILSMSYSPDMIRSISSAIQSQKDKAEIAAAQARAQAESAAAQEHTARLPLIEAQTREADLRGDKLTKEGAITKAPTSSEIKSISDLVQEKYNLDTPDELARARNVSRIVAERMKSLRANNPAMTQVAAAKQAFQEADRRGDFGGLSSVAKTPGASPAKPLPMPSKDGRLSPSALKPNQYYKGIGKYSDKTYLWTGEAFIPVGTGPGEVSEESSEDKDEDTEEAE